MNIKEGSLSFCYLLPPNEGEEKEEREKNRKKNKGGRGGVLIYFLQTITSGEKG